MALLAAYNFSGTGTSVADDSGNGHTGTLSGSTVKDPSGHTGNGISNPGSPSSGSGCAISRTGMEPTTAVTIMGWFKSDVVAGAVYRAAISKGRTSSSDSYGLYTDYDVICRPHFDVTTTSGTVSCDAGTAVLNDGLWHHLAGTWDGTNAKLYVDGTLVATVALGGTLIYDTGINVKLMGSEAWPAETPIGILDDVRIYSHALTGAEVTTDMGTPVTSGSTGGSVTAVKATGTGAAGVPVVTGGAAVTGVKATGTGAAIPPAVSAGSGASVTAVSAAGSGLALPPTVSGSTSLSGGGPATATGAAIPPVVTGGATVLGIKATGTGLAVPPAVTTSGSVGVNAVAATAAGAAIAPTVTGIASAAITAVAAIATGAARPPAVEALAPSEATYLFRTPTVRVRSGSDSLWSRIGHDEGIAVVRTTSGTYRQERLYIPDRPDVETVYLGGYDHTITQTEADLLIAAGYGEYLTAVTA